jgi:hypothetical protein
MDLRYPQTLNRYAYVGNNPLGYIDPTGLEGGSVFPCIAAVAEGGLNPGADGLCGFVLLGDALLGDLFSNLFSHPKFKGSHTPRPGTIWDEHGGFQPHADIAGALGLPSGGCEFGSCGGAFQNAGTMTLPTLGGAAACAAAEPCGAIAIGVAAAGAVGTAIYMGRKQVNEKVDEARRVAPLDPCGYLKSQLAGASTVDKLKINTALKFLGCRNVGKDRGGPNK